MFKGFVKKGIVLSAIAVLGAPSSYAATQGSVGTTSQGTVNINAIIPQLVRISNLSDIAFTWSGAGNLAQSQDVCVWANTSGGTYQITATGNGGTGSNQFKLSGATDIVDYNIFWNDISGSDVGQVATTSATVLTGRTGANTQDPACAVGGLSARFRIEIPETGTNGLAAAAADTYTGVVTFLVAPE